MIKLSLMHKVNKKWYLWVKVLRINNKILRYIKLENGDFNWTAKNKNAQNTDVAHYLGTCSVEYYDLGLNYGFL